MDHASGVPTLSRWGLSNQVDIMRNDNCKPKSATEFGVDLMGSQESIKRPNVGAETWTLPREFQLKGVGE